MGDFIELGLEGADKLIDKHFHKVPDKYVDPETYKPHHRLRKGSKDSDSTSLPQPQQERERQQRQRRTRDSRDEDYERGSEGLSENRRSRRRRYSPEVGEEPENIMAANNNHNGRPLNNANSSPYLQDGPFVTPPWTTTIPPPPTSNLSPQFSPTGARQQPTYVYTNGQSYPSRPSNMRRRSSSYHGPRRGNHFQYSSDESDNEASDNHSARRNRTGQHQQLATRNRSSTRHSQFKEKEKEQGRSSHHDLKDNFTNSKEGLAGGALGALVGGWATHKALESRNGKGRGGDEMWTVLGAAVGGLAVNAVVDKWEDKKKDEKRRDRGRDGEKGFERGGSGGGRARSERGRGRDWDSEYEEPARYYR